MSSLQYITGQDRKKLKSKGPWLDVNEPQVIFSQGKRKAGKGVAIDELVYLLWQAGITVMHLWAARNNENWYYSLVKGCMAYWANWRKEHDSEIKTGLLEEPLHCNCHRALPISVMLPENIYNSMKMWQIDRFNGLNFSSIEEYNYAYDKGLVFEPYERIKEFIPPGYDITSIKKPAQLVKKGEFFPLIKVKKFTVPSLTSASAQNRFWNDFVNIFLEARAERRIIVMNPMMFTGYDKFHTGAYILNNLYKLTQKYCPPLEPEDCGVQTREQMSIIQKSNHKVAVVLGEIKTMAPSQKLNPEAGVGETKKALYNMIGEARHWQCWLISDYQSPEDLFSGVKHQSDVYIIKRATQRLLGDDWSHLFPEIDKKRQIIFDKMNGRNPRTMWVADNKFPEINHLPDNLGYIVVDDEITKLQKFHGGSWHHKHTREQFTKDFKIDIPEEVLSNLKKEIEEEAKESKNSKEDARKPKVLNAILYKEADYYIIKNPKWNYKDVQDQILKDHADEKDMYDHVKSMEPDSLGQGYRRWLKKKKN